MNIYKFDSLEERIQFMEDALNEQDFFENLDVKKRKELLEPYIRKNPNITRVEVIIEVEKLVNMKKKSAVLKEYL